LDIEPNEHQIPVFRGIGENSGIEMMINRRKMLQGMAAAAVAAPLFPSLAQAASNKGKPKRVIFFCRTTGSTRGLQFLAA
jgi:uncharacterized protein (DUF1501 family)